MMIYKWIFIILLIVGCKTQKFTDKSTQKNFNEIDTLLNIKVQHNDPYNIIELNNNTLLKISPNIGKGFSKYLSENKTVNLVLNGNLMGEHFSLINGRYQIIDKSELLSDSFKITERQGLDFTDFGFIVDEEKFKRSILYFIYITKFEVILKDEILKEKLNRNYTLVFVIE
jgi:hypothetical protein